MEKIDIVLLWVDGGDPEWQKEKNEYSPVKVDYSSSDNRFRDWDNLQYVFRGIEKNAPWVNNIFFITWGHLPKWLNTNHPKLKIINHKDYIPEEYLPTFNSNVIELNLFRIKELSEHFVLMNDDIFFINSVKPEDFFENSKPKDEMVLNAILPMGEKFRISQTNLNNMNIINTNFSKKEFMKKHKSKLLNLRYGSQLLRSMLLMPYNCFVGFRNPHICASHLKSTFEMLWNKEYEKLNTTCLNKFRGTNDINHWLMRYWNLCSGNFVPRSPKFGCYFNLAANNSVLCNHVRNRKSKVVCMNDMSTDFDFEKVKNEINDALQVVLGEKSSFEI